MPELSRLRFPALLLAMIALLVGLWVGFVRLGWQVNMQRPALIVAHGPLMVSGFLGTLISVERAVAMQKRAAYLPALLAGLGGAAVIAGLPRLAGAALITLGSLGLVIIFVQIVRQHRALHTVVMALGAVSWLAGNVLWLAGLPIYQVVMLWAGFLILTIAGERLELSRVLKLSDDQQAQFAGLIVVLIVGLILSVITLRVGRRLAGFGMGVLAIWLLLNDVARRTVRREGLTRFIAVCLLAGYVWLLVGGVLLVLSPEAKAGLNYDAMLHAIFVGFTFSIIFGHAPIIFPAVLGRAIDYTPLYYGHLVLLHLSLLLRVGGDLAGWVDGRKWGGLLNAIAVLLFLVMTAAMALRGARQTQHT